MGTWQFWRVFRDGTEKYIETCVTLTDEVAERNRKNWQDLYNIWSSGNKVYARRVA